MKSKVTGEALTLHRGIDWKTLLLSALVMIALFFSDRSTFFIYRINISSVTMYTALMLIMVLLFLMQGEYYFDSIALLLGFRLIVYLIPLMGTGRFDVIWGNYLAVVASFLSYLFFSQSHSRAAKYHVNWIMVVFVFGLSLQVIYLANFLGGSLENMGIGIWKYHLALPIGSSNYIASIILLLWAYVQFSGVNWKVKCVVSSLALIAIWLIMSRTAIFVVMMLFLVWLAPYMLRILRSSPSPLFGASLVIFVVFVLGLAISYVGGYILVRGDMGMAFNSASLFDTLNALTSGRLGVLMSGIEGWTYGIFFGQGFAHETFIGWSHNWIVDLLTQSGVVGFTLFSLALYIWFRRVLRASAHSNVVRGALYACVATLLLGLGEVVLFTLAADFIIWALMGLAISEVNSMKTSRV